MLEALKVEVCRANQALAQRGLAILTWGSVSAVDRERNAMVVKPSGVPYDEMSPGDMVIVGLNGEVLEGELHPSSDTPTHLCLYREWPDIGGVAHTHSPWATSWAQARKPIPAFGTTHADTFYGPIPCTPALTREETEGAYEHSTGEVILRAFKEEKISSVSMPGVLVGGHAPFAWGRSADEAVERAEILEEVAMMAAWTLQISPSAAPVDSHLLDRHFRRKHDPNACQGRK